VKEVYGWKIYRSSADQDKGRSHYAKYARLNLDNFEIEELAEWKGYIAFYSPNIGVFYALEMDDAAHEAKLYAVDEGMLNLLKTFKDVDPMYGLNSLDISRSGILVKKGNKIEVYALPDLKKVKFKKL
jgi:hypothetical protein